MNNTTSAQDLPIKHLSLFQNGIAFFQKTGAVDASTRQVKFDGLPVSIPVQEQDSSGYDRSDDDNFVLFGSVWFSSPANPLLRTTVFNEEEETQVTASTLTEILQNNPDKAIHFTLKNDPASYSGKNDYTRSVVVRERAGLNSSREEDDQEASASGGLSDEDLFAYQAENLSLPKGGRMSIQLLETDISYEDVYSVQLNKDLRDLGRSNKKTVNTVWHSLKFKNASGVPLPTGAISFVKDENDVKQLISQNKLDFVPAGLLARVKMTQVPDAFVFDYERLSEFEENTKQRWKLAAIEATIEAGNFRKQAITLEVEREIAGELLESDFPWTTSEPEVKQPGAKNQSREVRWVFTLQPGEQKKITYSYTVYLL